MSTKGAFLESERMNLMFRGLIMQRKKAIITVEPVDASIEEDDEKIEKKLPRWLREDAISIP
jgi:hypothetical protein